MNDQTTSNRVVEQNRRTNTSARYGSVRRLCLTVLFDVFVGVGVWGCDDGTQPGHTTELAPDQADQMLVRMAHVVTANGVVRAKIEADTTYIHTSGQMADMRNVRVTFYDAQGNESSTLTSKVGTYQLRTGDMEGKGNVVVRTKDGRRLTTEVLRYNQLKDSVSSDKDFVFDAPDRHLEGEGFTSDPSFRNVTANKVRGTDKRRFVLPNQ